MPDIVCFPQSLRLLIKRAPHRVPHAIETTGNHGNRRQGGQLSTDTSTNKTVQHKLYGTRQSSGNNRRVILMVTDRYYQTQRFCHECCNGI
jgi:hypothetical protein